MSKGINPSYQRLIDNFQLPRTAKGQGKGVKVLIELNVYGDGKVFLMDGSDNADNQAEACSNFADLIPGIEALIARAVAKAKGESEVPERA